MVLGRFRLLEHLVDECHAEEGEGHPKHASEAGAAIGSSKPDGRFAGFLPGHVFLEDGDNPDVEDCSENDVNDGTLFGDELWLRVIHGGVLGEWIE